MNSSPKPSRRDLARFLKTRRAKISPSDVGLPAGDHRRTPGLRREEVAILAGVSPTWYTYLEQGRDIHPSQQVLDALSRVLQLTEDERRYLHLLALSAIHGPKPLRADLPAAEIVRQLVAITECSPYPVYGVDLLCDLIAWNPATTTYYTDFAAMPTDRRNMLRWLLEAPEARKRLADWSDDLPDVVARWRAMTALHHNNTALQNKIAEFRDLAPEFTTWWDQFDVREHRSRTRRFALPDHQEPVVLRLIVVQAIEFDPCVVVYHVPT